MSKQLILLRHAEALEKQAWQEDKDRELSSNGVMQATRAAMALKDEEIKIDFIFSSSAIRTNMTTAIVAGSLGFDQKKILYHDELYDASTRTFLQFINAIGDELQSVLCVGHNPVITYLAEYLTKSDVGNMSPGTFVVMTTADDRWAALTEGSATLKLVYSGTNNQ